jgi:antirestriction protein ArdC
MANAQKAYQVITDRIVAALENDTVPWRKPWSLAPGQRPQNANSKRPYSGINALVLGLAGFSDPRWTTFKAARKDGGHVRKGERGTPVVFWKTLERDSENDAGETETKTYWMLRYYTVFNVEQIDGLDLPTIETPETFDPIAAADAIVAAMPKPPSITHNGSDQAYYRPSKDTIHLPPVSAFDTAAEYYSTAFHELGHSTGHETRLNRHGLETGIAPFGSPTYSREELVAEFTAAFLCAESGINNTVENSTAYIAGWAKAIRKDPKLVISAASLGEKAANYIVNR